MKINRNEIDDLEIVAQLLIKYSTSEWCLYVCTCDFKHSEDPRLQYTYNQVKRGYNVLPIKNFLFVYWYQSPIIVKCARHFLCSFNTYIAKCGHTGKRQILLTEYFSSLERLEYVWRTIMKKENYNIYAPESKL